MKKIFKRFLILGACLFFIGGGIFLVAFAKVDFDIRALSATKTREERYEETSIITSLSLEYTADINVVATDGEKLSVSYSCPYNRKGDVYEVEITEENGRLSIVEKTKQHFSLSFFNFYSHDITVYVPKDRVLDIQIQTNTGDIKLGNGTFGKIDLATNTGDIVFGATTATEISVSVDTGDVDFNGNVLANTLTIQTDTGDIDGNGVITAQTVDVETATGDIELILSGKQTDYTIIAKTNTGDQNIHSGGSGEKKLSVSCSTGDIEIDFR